jgi:hypothetical protein
MLVGSEVLVANTQSAVFPLIASARLGDDPAASAAVEETSALAFLLRICKESWYS